MRAKLYKCLVYSAAMAVLQVQALCPEPGEFSAVDLSQPVDQGFLNKMRELEVRTIIRYYDHIPETIRGKTLKRSERRLIAQNGFDLLIVFQHRSARIGSFTSERGQLDAQRSLELAEAMGQPARSAIYFAVDNNWNRPSDLRKIKTYFYEAGLRVRAAGYKIGGYGSGLVCDQLLNEGLVEYCWLSNASRWYGHDDFFESGRWSLKQYSPRFCAGRDVDFNIINTSIRDIGQF
ncbi:MAG: glycoside hydrolase domain-containing protein [Bdellovibrionales bacterium]